MIRESRQLHRSRPCAWIALSCLAVVLLASPLLRARPDAKEVLSDIGFERGICAVLGLPSPGGAELVVALARESELVVYFQAGDEAETTAVREAAETAGLLGVRVFVGDGELRQVGLAGDIAGAVLLSPNARVEEREILRILHPGGKVIGGKRPFVKLRPEGLDSWSHPFHGPDNNPQSTDHVARAPYMTQFLAEPLFCPMPEISVAAGGRVFRAFGHIAHRANQNAMLNTLICVNAYNGTILWKRKLTEGFMIHRNTMIATPEMLYLADHQSLKMIDAESGKIVHEVVVPAGKADGGVWKWMAIDNGVLYALVGATEFDISTKPSGAPGLGHWPWGMWEGHDYSNPKKNFGFGRNFIAVDLETREILWNHGEEEYVDTRGICMKGERIYFWTPGKHLACLDTNSPRVLWRNSDENLLSAIGADSRAQHYVTGYSTTTFIKCTDDEILFAGPQREALVSASTEDGRLLWKRPGGNLQLVLRDDGIYAAGPQKSGVRLAYGTGNVLASLPTRRACTRATGSIDSVFYRTTGGTVRLDVEDNAARHIAPMRPPCQDGVMIAEGHLYWGPWMCGCQLSLYGHIALGPVGDFNLAGPPLAERLQVAKDASIDESAARADVDDWPCYRGDNQRRDAKSAGVPSQVSKLWKFRLGAPVMPTAPIAVGDRVFFGDRSGIVRCLNSSGEESWKAYTGGSIFFPPAVDAGRLFVGSADGWLYCFDPSTGRRLWRFRVAPQERRVPVYGNLISTWPLAGGVVAQDGVVYTAAGIAHYDGTHVVALDARTGKVKWHNGTSGQLSAAAESGVSLQGALSIVGRELRFAGGGRQLVARFDLETGKCLNQPRGGVTSQFQTAFYPYFPDYAEHLACRRDYPDGRTLFYDPGYDGNRRGPLQLLEAGPGKIVDEPRRDDRRRDAAPNRRRRGSVWSVQGERYNSLIAANDAVVAAGQRGERSFLAAIDLESGARRWEVELEARAVKGGAAIDRGGRILVSLRNGVVECYAARRKAD